MIRCRKNSPKACIQDRKGSRKQVETTQILVLFISREKTGNVIVPVVHYHRFQALRFLALLLLAHLWFSAWYTTVWTSKGQANVHWDGKSAAKTTAVSRTDLSTLACAALTCSVLINPRLAEVPDLLDGLALLPAVRLFFEGNGACGTLVSIIRIVAIHVTAPVTSSPIVQSDSMSATQIEPSIDKSGKSDQES